ncbi:MAG: DUF2794 domain-containing protein, partial [Pseudomonadota bacterium]
MSKEASLSDSEPITERPARPDARGATVTRLPKQAPRSASTTPEPPTRKAPLPICFNRQELYLIMNVYGRQVAAGEWRDYAIDMLKDRAVFSIFRHASEFPLYRIEKNPKLARKQ